jgi:hypothetical protein
MKRTLLLIATVVVTLIGIQVATAEIAAAFHQLTNQNVKWIGYVVSYGGPEESIMAWAKTGYEMGLREDGVVVWRKK